MKRPCKYQQQSGFAILLISAMLMLAASMLSLILSNSVVTHQRSVSNELRTSQALNAAQAGLEYGIVYLDQNYETIADGQTTSGTLSDGSGYSAQFTFQGSKDLIKIVVTGTSGDGTATRTVSQIVSYVLDAGSSSVLVDLPIISRGDVNLKSNARVTNMFNDNTILSGGGVTLKSNAKTILASGTASTNGNFGADITMNDALAASKTDEEMQNEILGDLISNYSMTPDITYDYSSDHDYSSQLDGVEGQKIRMNQNGSTAEISSNTTVGSSSNPVTLYVDGDLDISSNVTIYGDIYVTGNINMSSNVQIHGNIRGTGDVELSSNVDVYGNVTVTGEAELNSNAEVYGLVFALSSSGIQMDSNSIVYGGVVSGGPVQMNSNSRVIYDEGNLQGSTGGSSSSGKYAKVPGSWNDLGQ